MTAFPDNAPTGEPRAPASTFTLKLTAGPQFTVHSLRKILKLLKRRFDLKCVELSEEREP